MRLLILLLLCCSTVLTAQQKKEAQELKFIVPGSIYTGAFNSSLDSLNRAYPLLHEFNTSLNFIKFSHIDLNRGIMTVPIQRFSDVSKSHFYETYQVLHERSYYREAFDRSSGKKFFDIHNYKARFKPKQ